MGGRAGVTRGAAFSFSLWLLCRAAGQSENRRDLFSRRPVLKAGTYSHIPNLRKRTFVHCVQIKPRDAAEVDSEAGVLRAFGTFGPEGVGGA